MDNKMKTFTVDGKTYEIVDEQARQENNIFSNNLNEHIDSTDIHITANERINWNDKYTKEEIDNLLIEKANAINQLSEEKADKEFVVSIFEQLKALIEAGKTDEVIAVLDEAILDLAVLA